jgi:hypothetical protein
MTIGVILETGFLTRPVDRAVIVDDPDLVARAILDAVRVRNGRGPELSRGASPPAYEPWRAPPRNRP